MSKRLTENLVLARTRAPNLASVKKLNCWAHELDDISILRKLKNVEIVTLSVNKITTLEPLKYCKNLQELYIRNNNIANLAEICYLKDLKHLRVLWLADNPCAVGDKYRMTVLKTLPNINKLDNITVQEEERNDAIDQGCELESLTKDNPSSRPPPTPREEKADPFTLTLLETNKIREELGLKALAADKVSSPAKERPSTAARKAKNESTVMAVLLLLNDLDTQGLEIINSAIQDRLGLKSNRSSADVLTVEQDEADGCSEDADEVDDDGDDDKEDDDDEGELLKEINNEEKTDSQEKDEDNSLDT